MLGVGKKHTDLTKYLLKEATQSHEQRMNSLRTFMPQAKNTDWSLAQAGQRVQIIKQCDKEWGRLEFGTEIVSAQDGSLAALLGASPGASVSAKAMLDVIERCFQKELAQDDWVSQIKLLIPAYGQSLIDDADLLRTTRQHTHKTLQLI